MKTRLTKLIILASLFLTACKPQNAVEPIICEYIELMANEYTKYYYDYPETLNELISNFQNLKDKWMNYPNADTIGNVLSFLEHEKEDITWIYCHPTFITLTVGALYNDDTLFYKTTKWYYPYIDSKIRAYIRHHLEYPKSLGELLRFDSIVCDQNEDDAIDCWDVTRKYYWDNRDKLEWIVNDDFLLIKSGQDTIDFTSCLDSYIRSKEYLHRNRVVVFTDIQGKYDYSEDTRCDFLLGLKSFRDDFLNRNQCKNSKSLYMIEYRRGIGFSRFCENDDFSLDTKWFKEMEKYVSQFAQEHELERILFYTPAFEVK